MKFTTFWELRPYSFVAKCQHVVGGEGEPAAIIFSIGNEDSRLL
jgi:hypothetical protein